MPISYTEEVGFVGRAIGIVDWRDSMTNDMCGAGVGMRCGLKTPENCENVFLIFFNCYLSNMSGALY